MSTSKTLKMRLEKNYGDIKAHKHESISKCVEYALEGYFHDLDDQTTHDLYHLVVSEVEAALLEVTLKHTLQNQSKASEMLGLNRGTLRKKLKQHNLL
ncbi:MAG: helix-turn-helix domain-containing protein [Porticoccus sp.]|mgnify:CR=1 FL=1|jgi:Fis family transcriptional regulator, factor for inversion stimulation protein|tara:strand:+ start:18389 stop:18682 length:294 start_codon:yes stop_codon:yes gene_type:complete